MGIKTFKPKTPSLRHTILGDKTELSKKKPNKSLTKGQKYNAGRSKGRITVRHKGGRVKRLYRSVDFKRDKVDMKARVERIEYDPNRSANIALVIYEDGERRYILRPKGLKVGDTIVSGESAAIRVGNSLPLSKIPSGIKVHNVELNKGEGGKLCRSAGSSVLVMGGEGDYVQLKMASGEIRLVAKDNYATIGEVGNEEHSNIQRGKAGRKRYLGIRPTVRGQAMGAKDHPHGGGEAKDRVGGQRKTVYGKRTDRKTRKRKKKTNKFIVKRRKVKSGKSE